MRVIIFLLALAWIVDGALAGSEDAQRFDICGRRYTICQSSCVFEQMENSRIVNGVHIPCDPKNNIIAQCRNACYQEYTRCIK